MDRQSSVTPNGETLAASYSLPYLFPAVESASFFCSAPTDQRVYLPIAAQSGLPDSILCTCISALRHNLCGHANAALPEGNILRAW